jgi:predicted GH43/DUF377 family glycosyl hydrolase
MIKFIGIAHGKSGPLLYFTKGDGKNNSLNFVGSVNGFEFSGESQEVKISDDEGLEDRQYSFSSFRVTKQEERFFLTYKTNLKSSILGAVSDDLLNWEKTGLIDGIHETATAVPDYKHMQNFVMYFGEKDIRIAYSSFLYFWKASENPVISPRKGSFDEDGLEAGNAFLLEDAILLTYYVKKKNSSGSRIQVGAATFKKDEPTEVIWRSREPIWEQPEDLDDNLTPLGSAIVNEELLLYFVTGDNSVVVLPCPLPHKKSHDDKPFSYIVKKHDKNPIIAPRSDYPWESRATFNSAAIYDDGKVHFIYRALGDKDLSVLGHAASSDGFNLDERSNEPIYIPREPFETPGGNMFSSFADHFASGGGYGGIEDPRVTRVDDKLYLTYVAFDGANPPRAAMSSINVDDFRNKKWETWAKAKLISAPGMINKSAVIFPKKVDGKYVIMHRVYPNILIDYLDDLEFDNYLEGHYFIPPRRNFWDSKKIGAGAPPMETPEGWLLIYQSVGYQDPGRYKVGAMMLDKNNPAKVLYRTRAPIIEPDEPYENEGFKAGVVYPCGAVIMNNNLNIYYGGADTVVCAASADLERFVYEMKNDGKPKLKKIKSPLFN